MACGVDQPMGGSFLTPTPLVVGLNCSPLIQSIQHQHNQTTLISSVSANACLFAVSYSYLLLCVLWYVQGIQVLVLDEADRLLEETFNDEVREVVKACPRQRQTMLFSATLSEEVMYIAWIESVLHRTSHASN